MLDILDNYLLPALQNWKRHVEKTEIKSTDVAYCSFLLERHELNILESEFDDSKQVIHEYVLRHLRGSKLLDHAPIVIKLTDGERIKIDISIGPKHDA